MQLATASLNAQAKKNNSKERANAISAIRRRLAVVSFSKLRGPLVLIKKSLSSKREIINI